MSEEIVQSNEEVIKGQIKELVRNSVEETLNELLEKEAERDIIAGGLLNTTSLPDRATRLVQTAMCQALRAYWLQHLYMRECEAAVRGETFRSRVTLADVSSDDKLRNVLDSVVKVCEARKRYSGFVQRRQRMKDF